MYCLAEAVPNTSTLSFWKSFIEYCKLHVPAKSLEAYKATAPWSGFKSIVAIGDEPTGIEMVKSTEIKTNDYFDLNGRRLNGEPTQKGVYIHNGKKVVKK